MNPDQRARASRALRAILGLREPVGADGLLTEVETWVTGKQYLRGVLAAHNGGTWQAKCTTIEEPQGQGEWRCVAVGLSGIKVLNTAQPREKKLAFMLCDGRTLESELVIDVPIHKGKWNPTEPTSTTMRSHGLVARGAVPSPCA